MEQDLQGLMVLGLIITLFDIYLISLDSISGSMQHLHSSNVMSWEGSNEISFENMLPARTTGNYPPQTQHNSRKP